MKTGNLTLVLLLLALVWPATAFGQLAVLHSGGFAEPYREVLPRFEKASGLSVTSTQAASQGPGANTIPALLRSGAAADVVIMTKEGLNELIAEGRIDPATVVDLAAAGLGAAVRAGLPKPDISSVEGFKQALQRARSINIISTTGIYMTDKLFPALGIASEVGKKVNNVGLANLPQSDTDLVLRPISEIINLPGFDYVGPIPKEIQYVSVFTAAVVRGSKRVEEAKRLITFLSSDEAAAAARKSGMEPVQRK